MNGEMNLDWVLGALALAIALGGLWMLFNGMGGMNDDGAPQKAKKRD